MAITKGGLSSWLLCTVTGSGSFRGADRIAILRKIRGLSSVEPEAWGGSTRRADDTAAGVS
jgi:hypothetical protein